MFAPITQLLEASTAVTSICGSNIYRDNLPQQLATSPPSSYIIWEASGGTDNNYLDEAPGIDNGHFPIMCYAKSQVVATSLAVAARNALQSSGQMLGQPVSEYAWETKLYVVMLDFSFWTNRA